MLLPFDTIGDRIGPIVDAWLGEDGPPPDAVNLFLRAFRQHRRGRFDREAFQNLVTALEALADAEGIGAPLTDRAAARELRCRLESVIEEFVQRDIEEFVKEDIKKTLLHRISQINKGTLNQKLAGISSILPPDVSARFAVLREPLLGKIVHTRNYHAHRSGRSDKVLHEEELFQTTDQLQLLALLLLLRAAGFSPDTVMTRMLERWDFRQILERGPKSPGTG